MKRLLAVCSTVVLLISCQTEAPSSSSDGQAPAVAVEQDLSSPVAENPSQPRGRATEIESSKETLRTEARSSSVPGGALHITRYYVGRSLVLVEEILESPSLGRSESAYFFDDNRLIFFRGLGTRTIYGPDGKGVTERYDIELGFDAEGEVVDSKKIVNGSEAELQPLDWGAPAARARAILNVESNDK